mmetsp:Transcript_11753/g.23869  ORF Transcript_11753/g.23869 Transcript_11753/m.23869 type:complete len:121 (-) Transcript_11753:30-392(-)
MDSCWMVDGLNDEEFPLKLLLPASVKAAVRVLLEVAIIIVAIHVARTSNIVDAAALKAKRLLGGLLFPIILLIDQNSTGTVRVPLRLRLRGGKADEVVTTIFAEHFLHNPMGVAIHFVSP